MSEQKIYGLRADRQLIANCQEIAKAKDSNLSREIRKMLRRYRENNKYLLT